MATRPRLASPWIRRATCSAVTLRQGGGDINGTVFELSPQPDGTWTETILYDFINDDRDGAGPLGGVVFDKAGNLYGTASAGGDANCLCGVVFKMTPDPKGATWKYRVLHRFTGKDGWVPAGHPDLRPGLQTPLRHNDGGRSRQLRRRLRNHALRHRSPATQPFFAPMKNRADRRSQFGTDPAAHLLSC